MTPALIRLAFDSGWSAGCPGSGRVRFSSPKLSQSSFICVNARDAQDSLLDELVPTWGIGDVLVIERASADRNRVVAWIIGPIHNGGSYYRVPIIVRTVNGGFAAHDELVLHHHKNVTETDEPEKQIWAPPQRTPKAPELPLPPVNAQPPIAFNPEPPLALIAPLALTNSGAVNSPENGPLAPLIAPIAGPELTNAAVTTTQSARDGEIAQLRTDVTVLHDILTGLLTDTTELYVVEKIA